MRKSFKLENLECANCAAKMEEAINKLDTVSEANIGFMTCRLTMVAEDMDLAISQAQNIITKYEKDCKILV